MRANHFLNRIGNQIACDSGFGCVKIFENRISETRSPGLTAVSIVPRTSVGQALERTSLEADQVDQVAAVEDLVLEV